MMRGFSRIAFVRAGSWCRNFALWRPLWNRDLCYDCEIAYSGSFPIYFPQIYAKNFRCGFHETSRERFHRLCRSFLNFAYQMILNHSF